MTATREIPVSTPPCRSPFCNDLGGEGDYYYNARWYDADTGRFISEDPARDGQNWYVYTSNNPIKYVDPTGLIFGLSSEESGEYDSDSKRPIEKDDDDDGDDKPNDPLAPENLGEVTPAGPQASGYMPALGPFEKLLYDMGLGVGALVNGMTNGWDSGYHGPNGEYLPPGDAKSLAVGTFLDLCMLGVGGLNADSVFNNPSLKNLFTSRQQNMLEMNVGYNVSPESWFKEFDSIGRSGTYITDKKALTGAIGNFSPGSFNSKQQGVALEKVLGLNPGTLGNGFRITEVSGIKEMAPRSPIAGGNEFFQGGGKGLPGGGPEMIINSIPTR